MSLKHLAFLSSCHGSGQATLVVSLSIKPCAPLLLEGSLLPRSSVPSAGPSSSPDIISSLPRACQRPLLPFGIPFLKSTYGCGFSDHQIYVSSLIRQLPRCHLKGPLNSLCLKPNSQTWPPRPPRPLPACSQSPRAHPCCLPLSLSFPMSNPSSNSVTSLSRNLTKRVSTRPQPLQCVGGALTSSLRISPPVLSLLHSSRPGLAEPFRSPDHSLCCPFSWAPSLHSSTSAVPHPLGTRLFLTSLFKHLSCEISLLPSHVGARHKPSLAVASEFLHNTCFGF